MAGEVARLGAAGVAPTAALLYPVEAMAEVSLDGLVGSARDLECSGYGPLRDLEPGERAGNDVREHSEDQNRDCTSIKDRTRKNGRAT
jgi:hypothetical protein